MPDGYRTSWRASGQQPALVELQQIAEYTPGLAFTHIKGYAGHPLNEAADSLAKLALRCSRGLMDRDRVAERRRYERGRTSAPGKPGSPPPTGPGAAI